MKSNERKIYLRMAVATAIILIDVVCENGTSIMASTLMGAAIGSFGTIVYNRINTKSHDKGTIRKV